MKTVALNVLGYGSLAESDERRNEDFCQENSLIYAQLIILPIISEGRYIPVMGELCLPKDICKS